MGGLLIMTHPYLRDETLSRRYIIFTIGLAVMHAAKHLFYYLTPDTDERTNRLLEQGDWQRMKIATRLQGSRRKIIKDTKHVSINSIKLTPARRLQAAGLR